MIDKVPPVTAACLPGRAHCFSSAEHGPLLVAVDFKDSLTARLSHVVSVDAYSFVHFL